MKQSKIKVTIEFIQSDENGEEKTVSISSNKELSEEEIEHLDVCESRLQEVSYEAMRKGMSAQMSYISKKK